MKEKTMISLITILLFINLLSVDLYSNERFELGNNQSSQVTVRIIKKDSPLRLKPNSASLIIKKLPLGSEFPVVETIDEWIKIKLPPDKDGIEITGYINKSFVEFIIKPVEKQQKESSKKNLNLSYNQLKENLEDAKARSSTGLTLSIVGTFVLGYGLYGTLNNPKTIYEYSGGVPVEKKEVRPRHLVADALGVIILTGGLVIHNHANRKVKIFKKKLKKLKEENKIASINPIFNPYKKEYGIQLRIVF